MVRNGLFVPRCAVLLLALPCLSSLAHGEDTESKLRRQLAVQAALQQGREHLQRGEYQAAVHALEKEIANVDGSRDYMNALREAYRGYIRELWHTNRANEARRYQELLTILDPGAQLELNAARPSAPPTIASLAAESGGTAPPPAAAYIARPQMPEDNDPFADSNQAPPSSARDLLDRARREGVAKNYTMANRLYEEANRLDSHAAVPYREFWAYCKLYAVTESMNKAGWNPPADTEKEVLAALALSTAPELQRQGKELLHAIQERHIEFRYVPAQGQRWAEVETANFRVIYHESRQRAEEAARVAETTRAAMIRKWFGEEPTPWNSKCLIFLYPTAEFYARQTHQHLDSPGHSVQIVEKDNPERLAERRIYLHCDRADMLTHVLPHETTHAVLMGRFGRHLVPRWADEGIAILSEPREKIDRYLKNVPSLRSQHELFTASQLMTMKDYPESRRVTAFYVQSISLVEFICAQKGGPQAFTRFVREGLQDGYETALQRNYGIRDFKELEDLWTRNASDNSSHRVSLSIP